MLPVDDDFVEVVAMAIAKNRLFHDASNTIETMTGEKMQSNDLVDKTFDSIFEGLWSSQGPEHDLQRSKYREDARSAISAINLRLLIHTPD